MNLMCESRVLCVKCSLREGATETGECNAGVFHGRGRGFEQDVLGADVRLVNWHPVLHGVGFAVEGFREETGAWTEKEDAFSHRSLSPRKAAP